MHFEYEKNKSFNRMSERLSRRGIKDSKVILQLADESLSHVNPYDVDLSEETKKKIIDEADFMWYFFRDILRVPDQGGEFIPYKLNEANLELLTILKMRQSAWITAPRQSLTRFTLAAWIIWNSIAFCGKNYKSLRVISKDMDTSKYFIEKLIPSIFDSLPSYMKSDITIAELLDNNFKYIRRAKCDSKLDADRINEVSTSMDLNIYLDAEFIPYIYNCYSTIPQSIFISTVADYRDAEYNGALDILDMAYPFTKDVYGGDYGHSNDEPYKLFHIKKQLCQLLDDPDDYDRMCADLGWDEDVIRREVLLERK